MDGGGAPISSAHVCPSCGAVDMRVFYEATQLPVYSTMPLSTRQEALSVPCDDLKLGFCSVCGFIANVAFEPTLPSSATRREDTQSFSPTFNRFSRRLALDLITRYNLRHKQIIEVGCGQGEFLTHLCQLGSNRGIGFDPAYVAGQIASDVSKDLTFIADRYSEKYAHYRADFFCCKMTLEHIPDVEHFVGTVRQAIADHNDTVVFFQVPDVVRILREVAFWDVYYEHCSYFSLGSLARLFHRCGFDVLDVLRAYGDQYLMLEAKAAERQARQPLERWDDLEALSNDVAHFAQNCARSIQEWRTRLKAMRRAGRRAVLWGGSSKAVAFLTTLRVGQEIEFVVDVNPHKQNTYIAGSGQQIVAPEFLCGYDPDLVILMNPVYHDEVRQELARLGLAPELIGVSPAS